MPFRLLPLLFAVLAGSAHAQVYKCVDASGRITYTNDRSASNGCTQLSQDLPVSSVPAPAASEPAANDFPRVDPGSQRERDGHRRAILEEELAQEQRALEEGQRELAEQEAVRHGNERNYQRVLDRLQPYKDKVELHQRNVEALQRELRGLR